MSYGNRLCKKVYLHLSYCPLLHTPQHPFPCLGSAVHPTSPVACSLLTLHATAGKGRVWSWTSCPRQGAEPALCFIRTALNFPLGFSARLWYPHSVAQCLEKSDFHSSKCSSGVMSPLGSTLPKSAGLFLGRDAAVEPGTSSSPSLHIPRAQQFPS